MEEALELSGFFRQTFYLSSLPALSLAILTRDSFEAPYEEIKKNKINDYNTVWTGIYIIGLEKTWFKVRGSVF